MLNFAAMKESLGFEVFPARDLHKRYLLTDFSPPFQKHSSGHADGGLMTHSEWIKCELEAFRSTGRNVFCVQDENGSLALAETRRRKTGF
jgi:hypothetical protein